MLPPTFPFADSPHIALKGERERSMGMEELTKEAAYLTGFGSVHNNMVKCGAGSRHSDIIFVIYGTQFSQTSMYAPSIYMKLALRDAASNLVLQFS